VDAGEDGFAIRSRTLEIFDFQDDFGHT